MLFPALTSDDATDSARKSNSIARAMVMTIPALSPTSKLTPIRRPSINTSTPDAITKPLEPSLPSIFSVTFLTISIRATPAENPMINESSLRLVTSSGSSSSPTAAKTTPAAKC